MSEQKRRPGRYPVEVRERAVRMVFEHQGEYPSQWKAIESIAKKLSINHETLRQWVRRAETDAGARPGLTTDELARMKQRGVLYSRRRREVGRRADESHFAPAHATSPAAIPGRLRRPSTAPPAKTSNVAAPGSGTFAPPETMSA